MSTEDENEDDKQGTLSKKFEGKPKPGEAAIDPNALFTPDEMDIYVNKVTLEAFIFHGKKIDYPIIDYLEYNPASHTVKVYKKDGTNIDLGVKIQWLVRPYFTKAEEVSIVQTKDGESIDGIVVPLVHKGQKRP